ncbi:hypothetical protein QBC38DRAFT_492766 [Podospora fimiseda]|uniref:Uncharacterized protein n=1 Tax=Podospora fimiseda TaxID=252190 RepID=A0AAN7BCU6_9PEZI|nr:hypothetical protein QBC38DRAFT_492766 [Podospora fimiseda]
MNRLAQRNASSATQRRSERAASSSTSTIPRKAGSELPEGALTVACPFSKHPELAALPVFLDCRKVSLRHMSDVKTHFTRRHMHPPYCPACNQIFTGKDKYKDRDKHIQNHEFDPEQALQNRNVNPEGPMVGWSKETLDEIFSHGKDPSLRFPSAMRLDERKWRAAFRAMFPGVSDDCVGSIYHYETAEEEQCRRVEQSYVSSGLGKYIQRVHGGTGDQNWFRQIFIGVIEDFTQFSIRYPTGQPEVSPEDQHLHASGGTSRWPGPSPESAMAGYHGYQANLMAPGYGTIPTHAGNNAFTGANVMHNRYSQQPGPQFQAMNAPTFVQPANNYSLYGTGRMDPNVPGAMFPGATGGNGYGEGYGN